MLLFPFIIPTRMDSAAETDSSCDDEYADDQVMVSAAGSVVITSSVVRPSSSSSSSTDPQMSTEELLVFTKLQAKIKLKNFHLISLKKNPDNPLKTNIVCETNPTGTTLSDRVVRFAVTITIGSPLSLEILHRDNSSSRPHSPLFDPIEDNLVSDFISTCQQFARTTRSLMVLLEFIDSYLEKTGCTEIEAPQSPVSDILRGLQISSHMEELQEQGDNSHANEESASDIIPSSGSTASRRSSRSTTPTMSDRI